MKKIKYPVYRSAIDFYVVFPFLIVVGAIPTVWLLPSVFPSPFWLNIAMTCLLGLVLIFLFWCVCSTYYVITETCVVVKMGLLKRRIAFESIKEIKTGKSVLPSYALGFRRVYICFSKGIFGRIEVSPKEQEEFVNELESKIKVYKENA